MTRMWTAVAAALTLALVMGVVVAVAGPGRDHWMMGDAPGGPDAGDMGDPRQVPDTWARGAHRVRVPGADGRPPRGGHCFGG